MGNQWQQKYLLEYNELVSNFPSPERVVSDYIKNCFKTDLPWFSRIDPDNAYFICFSQNRSNSRSYTGWDHLGKYKTEVLTLTQAALIILVIVCVFDDANQAQEFIKQRVQMCLTKKMKKKCSRRNTCIFYKSVILQVFMEKLCQITGRNTMINLSFY